MDMKKMQLHEEKVAGLKIAGAGSASVVATAVDSVSTWGIADWVQFWTLVFVLLQIGLLIPKYWRMFRRWWKNEPTHRRDDE